MKTGSSESHLVDVAAVQHRHHAAVPIEPRDERLLPGDGSMRINDTEKHTRRKT